MSNEDPDKVKTDVVHHSWFSSGLICVKPRLNWVVYSHDLWRQIIQLSLICSCWVHWHKYPQEAYRQSPVFFCFLRGLVITETTTPVCSYHGVECSFQRMSSSHAAVWACPIPHGNQWRDILFQIYSPFLLPCRWKKAGYSPVCYCIWILTYFCRLLGSQLRWRSIFCWEEGFSCSWGEHVENPSTPTRLTQLRHWKGDEPQTTRAVPTYFLHCRGWPVTWCQRDTWQGGTTLAASPRTVATGPPAHSAWHMLVHPEPPTQTQPTHLQNYFSLFTGDPSFFSAEASCLAKKSGQQFN